MDVATSFKKTVDLVIQAIVSADIAGLTRSYRELLERTYYMEPDFLDLRESVFVRWEQDCEFDASLQVFFKTVPTSREGHVSYAVTCKVGWAAAAPRYSVEEAYKALSLYKAIADLAAKIEFVHSKTSEIEFSIK